MCRSNPDRSEEVTVLHLPKKPKLSISKIHSEFTQVSVLDPKDSSKTVIKSKCKHCSFTLSGKNTTNLMTHLKSKHPAAAKKATDLDEAERDQIAAQALQSYSKATLCKQSKVGENILTGCLSASLLYYPLFSSFIN